MLIPETRNRSTGYLLSPLLLTYTSTFPVKATSVSCWVLNMYPPQATHTHTLYSTDSALLDSTICLCVLHIIIMHCQLYTIIYSTVLYSNTLQSSANSAFDCLFLCSTLCHFEISPIMLLVNHFCLSTQYIYSS